MENKFVAFVRNNTTFSTIILLVILGIGLYYRHQIFQAGVEKGTGKLNTISAMPIVEVPDIQKALDLGLTNFTYTVNPKTGEVMLLASGDKFKTKDETNPLKVIAITNLKEVGEGIAWQVLEVGIVNADLTLTTIGAGIGVSKDITKNAFIGGGVICDYEVKDFKSISDHTSLAIYGGFRF